MGLGCNAAGVVGARIIDSPREKLIAILTNAFVPCNGRFPFLITIASIFIRKLFCRSVFINNFDNNCIRSDNFRNSTYIINIKNIIKNNIKRNAKFIYS